MSKKVILPIVLIGSVAVGGFVLYTIMSDEDKKPSDEDKKPSDASKPPTPVFEDELGMADGIDTTPKTEKQQEEQVKEMIKKYKIRAMYGAGNKYIDATEKLKSYIDAGNKFLPSTDYNKIFTDPNYGVKKQLLIKQEGMFDPYEKKTTVCKEHTKCDFTNLLALDEREYVPYTNKSTSLKGHALTGLNDETVIGTTLDACKHKLLINPMYKSADFGGSTCYLSKNNRYSGSLRKSAGYTYIQKGEESNLPL